MPVLNRHRLASLSLPDGDVTAGGVPAVADTVDGVVAAGSGGECGRASVAWSARGHEAPGHEAGLAGPVPSTATAAVCGGQSAGEHEGVGRGTGQLQERNGCLGTVSSRGWETKTNFIIDVFALINSSEIYKLKGKTCSYSVTAR